MLLGASMTLPWYEKSFVPGEARLFIKDNLSAFEVFSFVEAAVLLVVAGVIYLLWARSQDRSIDFPLTDGTLIAAAGGWAIALLVWRLFDRPAVSDPGATVGIQWGIFVALIASGALIAAGLRIRDQARRALRTEGAMPARRNSRFSASTTSRQSFTRGEEATLSKRGQARSRRRSLSDGPFREIPQWEGAPPVLGKSDSALPAQSEPSESDSKPPDVYSKSVEIEPADDTPPGRLF